MSIKTEVIYEEDNPVADSIRTTAENAMCAEIGQVWSNGRDMMVLTMGEDGEMMNMWLSTRCFHRRAWGVGTISGHKEIRGYLLNENYTFLCDLGEIARELSEL